MRSTILALALLLCGAPDAEAQATFVLDAGTRIRVSTVRDRTTGSLLELRRDSVILFGDEGRKALLRSAMTRLEVSRGRQRSMLRGAALGALALGLGAMFYRSAENATCETTCPRSGNPAALAAGGALVGGGIGALIRTERWDRIQVPAPPAPGGGRR